ncbi:MAG TPA: TolC family outer membrane protein [Steroidobacteraceae bacterium]|nr:TolC family outer membrane protein [Steroidobacteraceae bacterium]
MTRKSLLLACSVAAALVVGTPARAENLIDVYQAALRSDPVLREAEARRMAALEAKPQARGLLLPQVDVTGQYATRDGESTALFLNQNDDGTVDLRQSDQSSDSDFWTYEAQVTQSLFRWDQWQALKRADAQVAVAEANFRAAQQNLLVRVSQAYFDVLAAEDTLTAAQATLEALTRQLEQADKRFEVGLIAITDVQEARAAHDSATAGVIAAKRTLAATQEVLRELTNEAYTTLAKPAEQMPLDAPNPADEQEWVARALENNLSVIAARLETEVAARDVKVARSGHYPTVDLFASRNEFDTDATQTEDTIGVQVTIPIFSGGVTQSRVRESVYLQRAAREKLEGTMRSAERETRDAYLGVIAEKARVQALAQAVKSSQTALEATEAGFEVGTRTTVDVLASRRTLFEAQRDYARSRYDYLINIVRLESAAGGLVQDDLASINSFLTSPTTLPVVRPQSTPSTTPPPPPPPTPPGG